MKLLSEPISIIRRHRRAYFLLNAAFYGLFGLAMALTLLAPELQGYFKPDIDQAYLKPGILRSVADAYASRNIVLAVGLTFAVNLAVAVFMTTVPSLIIPFIGILAVLQRGILWGIMFAPIGPHPAMLIPHSLTLFIEGQAYVLAGFAAYVHGRTFLRFDRYRLSSSWEAYKAGVVSTVRIYAAVIAALLVGAIYEVFEAIYIIPRLL